MHVDFADMKECVAVVQHLLHHFVSAGESSRARVDEPGPWRRALRSRVADPLPGCG